MLEGRVMSFKSYEKKYKEKRSREVMTGSKTYNLRVNPKS